MHYTQTNAHIRPVLSRSRSPTVYMSWSFWHGLLLCVRPGGELNQTLQPSGSKTICMLERLPHRRLSFSILQRTIWLAHKRHWLALFSPFAPAGHRQHRLMRSTSGRVEGVNPGRLSLFRRIESVIQTSSTPSHPYEADWQSLVGRSRFAWYKSAFENATGKIRLAARAPVDANPITFGLKTKS